MGEGGEKGDVEKNVPFFKNPLKCIAESCRFVVEIRNLCNEPNTVY